MGDRPIDTHALGQQYRDEHSDNGAPCKAMGADDGPAGN
jgi:hypothetical protein